MLGKRLLSILTVASLAISALAAPTIVSIINAGAQDLIPDRYIVVFKKSISETDVEAHFLRITSFHSKLTGLLGAKALGLQKKLKFSSTGLRAYTGGFDAATLQQILKSSEIAYVEQDSTVKINTLQANSTWGLERISRNDQYTADSPNGPPAPVYPYNYDGNAAGNGVTVYVIDTGVLGSHNEFKTNGVSRASVGFRSLLVPIPIGLPIPLGPLDDGNGHGTHCSGTIGGNTYGVAKKAKIVGVQVLSALGTGLNSDVLAGMQWVAENAAPNLSVASMSLGGTFSQSTNDAIEAMYNRGITVVVAAGNDGTDASGYSPASAPNAITVGAIDINNNIASFSNYGSAVDIFAPGVNVLSSWSKLSLTPNSETNVISGTSMACPHVAGLAAYYISTYGPSGASPQTIGNRIVNAATNGQIDGLVGDRAASPNKIAFNGYSV
ncbi:Oryzin [Dactylellina cionopaga]|nr:Oryzin [Dactylellina cionopaga]